MHTFNIFLYIKEDKKYPEKSFGLPDLSLNLVKYIFNLEVT